MVLLDSARREVPVPALARWLLGLGIAATLAANVAHGLGHGPVGAAVAASPAVALAGSYELFMTIIRGTRPPDDRVSGAEHVSVAVSGADPLRVQLPKCSPPTWRSAASPRSGLSARGCAWGNRAHSRYARISPHSVTGVSDSRDMTILRLDCAATLRQGSMSIPSTD